MAEQVTFKCLRCGHEFRGIYDTDVERMCPKCRSNSVRRVKPVVSKQLSVDSKQTDH
jgi:DNA-directed RNA polymerase subunit RPC12/RpoP